MSPDQATPRVPPVPPFPPLPTLPLPPALAVPAVAFPVPPKSTGDTMALTYPTGINGVGTAVKLRWNGAGVEIVASTPTA